MHTHRLAATAVAAAAFVAAGAATAVATAPAAASTARLVAVTPAHGQAIPGHYIVTVTGDPRAVAATAHATPRYLYDRALHGFAAALRPAQVDALRHDPHVLSIEQDAAVRAQVAAPVDWNLDRIDQRHLPLDGTYRRTAATAVTAYVIDTGIYISHPDFGGRAAVAYDALGGNGIDCNGHGTAVAGIIGGAAHGVVSGIALRSVRVLDCNGSGSNSGVIAGVDWVAAHHAARSVANMSLGGGLSSSVNSAVTAMVNAGVFVSVAGGGSNVDACTTSPASANGAVAVAATDRNDARYSANNYGGCIALYGPGVSIPVDWLNGGANTLSGSSFAAPHVAGVAAAYKAAYGDAAAATIRNWTVDNATPGVVTGNPAGTPNLLLYKP